MGPGDLPPLVPLPIAAIEASDDAHSELHAALTAADAPVQRLFRTIQMRHLTEAASTAVPVSSPDDRRTLVPRRRFVSPSQQGRLDGTRMALRHLDTRITMVRSGVLDHPIAAETPYVLNAFAESRNPSGDETNAGSVRATPSAFLDVENSYIPPAAAVCGGAVAMMIDVVRSAPVAPLAAAAWCALTTFAVHPFVDGNGRTARLLFHGVHSNALESSVDWGSLEAWAGDRARYMKVIQRSVASGGDGQLDLVDPEPFMLFAAEQSVVGAQRCRERLAELDRLFQHWRNELGSPEAAMVTVFVSAERNVTAAELDELGIATAEVRTLANHLIGAGVLTQSTRRGLNPAS